MAKGPYQRSIFKSFDHRSPIIWISTGRYIFRLGIWGEEYALLQEVNMNGQLQSFGATACLGGSAPISTGTKILSTLKLSPAKEKASPVGKKTSARSC